jgi:TolB protein
MNRRPLHTLVLVLGAVACAAPVAAQRDTMPEGVSLSTAYEVTPRPILAVRPPAGSLTLAAEAAGIRDILHRDLQYSDRFALVSPPERLAEGDVDYGAWNALRVMYLVDSRLERSGTGYRLEVSIHDVVYRTVLDQAAYELPSQNDRGFRMAVHAVSDDIVRMITGEPGMAATRIAFVRKNAAGSYDLIMIDSDGEDQRRIFGEGGIVYSPAFSPDGRKLAYVASPEMRQWVMVERELESGQTRELARGSSLMAPDYSPDGRSLVYAVYDERSARLLEMDLATGRSRTLYEAGGELVTAATYSPDGRRLAVVSSRLGNPHVFLVDAGGGGLQRVSPYARGQGAQFTGPDWSHQGQLTFTGGFGGSEQVVVTDPSRLTGQATQLTQGGVNEDPAWAPDGRHIVYTGSAQGSSGLYVVDTVTLTKRLLVSGGELRLPAWSPSLSRLGPPLDGAR